jgi:hypothetical protein
VSPEVEEERYQACHPQRGKYLTYWFMRRQLGRNTRDLMEAFTFVNKREKDIFP